MAAGLEAVHHVSVSMGVIPKHRNIWIRSGGVLLIFSSGYWEVLFAIHLGREPKGRWDTPAGILGCSWAGGLRELRYPWVFPAAHGVPWGWNAAAAWRCNGSHLRLGAGSYLDSRDIPASWHSGVLEVS